MDGDGPVIKSDVNAVRLQNAVLCPNCDVVSESPHDVCMVCGSRSLLPLSRVLGDLRPHAMPIVAEPAVQPPRGVPDNLLVLTSPSRRHRHRRAFGVETGSRVALSATCYEFGSSDIRGTLPLTPEALKANTFGTGSASAWQSPALAWRFSGRDFWL